MVLKFVRLLNITELGTIDMSSLAMPPWLISDPSSFLPINWAFNPKFTNDLFKFGFNPNQTHSLTGLSYDYGAEDITDHLSEAHNVLDSELFEKLFDSQRENIKPILDKFNIINDK